MLPWPVAWAISKSTKHNIRDMMSGEIKHRATARVCIYKGVEQWLDGRSIILEQHGGNGRRPVPIQKRRVLLLACHMRKGGACDNCEASIEEPTSIVIIPRIKTTARPPAIMYRL